MLTLPPLFNQAYALIVATIISLTLSSLYTKTAYDPHYVKPTKISDAVRKAATEKLFEAIETNNKALAFEAITEQASLNETNNQGDTPLTRAALLDHIKIVRLLLKHGANSHTKNKRGDIALTRCMYAKHPLQQSSKIIRLLLKHHTNKNIGTAPYDPIQFVWIRAAGEENTTTIRLLLEYNSDPNLQNIRGYTALMKAASTNNTEIIYLLLKNNASVDIQDCDNNTALKYAIRYDNTEAVKILILHGANPAIVTTASMQKIIKDATQKRTDFIKKLNQQNWDLETSSITYLLEQFMISDVASLVCAYANPYNKTIEPLMLHAMKHYIRNNPILAEPPQSTPAYVICCAAYPDCNCPKNLQKAICCNQCTMQ